MVYDNAVTKHGLKSFGQLGGQSNLGYQKKSLAASLYNVGYKVLVDFGLARRCDTMEQRYLVVEPRAVNLVKRFGLWFGKPRKGDNRSSIISKPVYLFF